MTTMELQPTDWRPTQLWRTIKDAGFWEAHNRAERRFQTAPAELTTDDIETLGFLDARQADRATAARGQALTQRRHDQDAALTRAAHQEPPQPTLPRHTLTDEDIDEGLDAFQKMVWAREHGFESWFEWLCRDGTVPARVVAAFSWVTGFASQVNTKNVERHTRLDALEARIRALEPPSGHGSIGDCDSVEGKLGRDGSWSVAGSSLHTKQLDGLEQRVKALEALPKFPYMKVWRATEAYAHGQVVTDHGSLWYANANTTGIRPGTSDAWTLCVQRGKAGKDAR